MKNQTTIITALVAIMLSGCSAYTSRPAMTPIETSISSALENKVMPESIYMENKEDTRAAGSLWQKGSNHFFKDSRASAVGDIVTVIIKEKAKAAVEAKTETSRVHDGTAGITNLLNLEGLLTNRGMAPGIASLQDTESKRIYTGDASTERDDKLEASIAAMVTQVLPNGYLVIHGQREVLVNYELQEINLRGIIRPSDINSDNTIASEKIAEARISYTGKGIIDEAQERQPAVRFLDKWIPF